MLILGDTCVVPLERDRTFDLRSGVDFRAMSLGPAVGKRK